MTRGSSNTVHLLTAPGVSAIAVIRLQGHEAAPFLARHFTAPLNPLAPTHGRLLDGDRELDDPVLIWSPHDQKADLCTHGGRWVIHSILTLAQREGFDLLSQSLPLSAAATDASDPIEQEILQHLPLARTQEAIATLLNQHQAWSRLSQSTINNQRSTILADRSLRCLLQPPRIAILGIPNAGKSTLANALFGQQRSIVADLPGTTRDYVSDFANIDGLPVTLLDTPGLRPTEDAIESAAIQISQDQVATADLQLLLIDPTQPLAPQLQLANQFPQAIQIATKADLASQSTINNQHSVSISAATGQGLPDLRLAIRRHFQCEELPHARPCAFTLRLRSLLL